MIVARTLSMTQNGMTLLELLLVVTILSAVAFMSLATVTDNTSQVRFDDTRKRLAALRHAIVGTHSLAPDTSGTLSGYVVDNGTLPIDVDGLITAPAGFERFGVVTPQFDPIPDSNGINNGPSSGTGHEIELTDPRHALMKGHRGIYLTGAGNGEYRDGWSTDRTTVEASGIDCPTLPTGSSHNGSDVQADNHGWCVTHHEAGIYIDSYGRDGIATPAPADPYDVDTPMQPEVARTDWRTNVLAGEEVTIVNETGIDIDFATWTKNPRVSLLVYRNDADAANEFQWRRITTSPSVHACLDGDGDDKCNSAIAPDRTTAAFATAFEVPVGEHLLVLVHDPDGNMHTADDTTTLPVGFATRRVKFYPRGGAPAMEIAIR